MCMDFTIKKPGHLVAFFMITLTFIVFAGFPLFSFAGLFPTPHGSLDQSSPFFSSFVELFILIIQFAVIIVLFILVPFLWYHMVNGLTFRQMLFQVKLHRIKLDMALVWGVVTAYISFSVVVFINVILTVLGFNVSEASNIKDLGLYFSVPSMFVLVTFQPIAEEIFFRGFLLEKFTMLVGSPMSILITSVLFGIAHLSAGNVYPAFMAGIVGLFLAVLVEKTQNLSASITAHVLFNLVEFSLYLFAQFVYQ